ncbi:MAG TPA: prolyl oligopeptidase family serine peptidase [Streptosporangiaceae bacterium]|nr:prolyl oligopeptidase family serine peptidase [Streptosporangiaceae bacterium]
MSPPPPAAPQRPAAPGADPYAWMRNTGDPAMRAYLAAERSYYDQQTAHTAAVRDRLREEMSAREVPADESVSWRRGEYAYFTRTLPGHEHEQFCRRVDGPGGGPVGGGPAAGTASPPAQAGSPPAEVLLDENLLLDDPDCNGAYVALGVREVSPDGTLLAYSVDFDGDEVYQLRIRDLASGEDLMTGAGLPERIGRTYYGLAWSADSRSLFYIVTNAAYRAYQVWRHDIGADPAQDVLVFTEDDERFDVIVRATRSGAYVLLETESRDTAETLVIPATDPTAKPVVLQERRTGVEYRADHADGPDGGEFYLVTNDGAVEFRLVRGPVTRAPGQDGWTEVIAGADGTRLVSCDVFGRFLVVEQRRAAAAQLRVIDRETGEQRLIEAAGPEVALALAVNEDYQAAAVTVRTQSLIDPPSWHDVDLASGGWRLRKRQQVPGYDPAGYRTQRITAPAPDGTAIPVTVAYRAGLPQDGTAPCLLYGYGAYEDCEWPEFSSPVVSLLDRGYVYAVAHIRGGGEGGRRWWLQGRLDRKRTTFTDFIAVADALADGGWAAGGAIVSRGLSAGGLLQGAVYSMAPQRWRAVVAEVPFVDVVNSMSDPTIPLTIAEWDEWGDPREPAMRAYMESYSPYDNVPAGPRPDLLVTGSLHDPRVLVHEPAKWVARLRATSPAAAAGGAGDGRVLFRAELGAAAHVGPSGRYSKLAYEAEVFAFILDTAGQRPGAGPG